MRKMRRSDRQITDNAVINDIISRCQYMRIGLIDEDGYAYMIPLNFGFEEIDGEKTFYFHGASKGKKIDLISEQGKCSFQMETGARVYGEGDACDYASAFECIMGHGKIELIEGAEAIHGLDVIMNHYEPGVKFEYRPEMLKAIKVIKLCVSDLTCKVHG